MSDDAAFDRLVAAIDGQPMMSPEQGRRIWDHFRKTQPELALDLGTYMGASAAYMAGAMRENGKGRVISIDTGQLPDWNEYAISACNAVWDRCGVRDLIEHIRVPDSYYSWWLLERVVEQTDASGVCEPLYDFAYLDGVKLLNVDGVCTALLAQLLKPGGWLLLDDLRWTYEEQPEFQPEVVLGSGARFTLSDAERSTAQIRAVFDYLVRPNPAYGNLDIDFDGWWGWAQRVTDSADVAPTPFAPRPAEPPRRLPSPTGAPSRLRSALRRYTGGAR